MSPVLIVDSLWYQLRPLSTCQHYNLHIKSSLQVGLCQKRTQSLYRISKNNAMWITFKLSNHWKMKLPKEILPESSSILLCFFTLNL